jgi:hypothetical protein
VVALGLEKDLSLMFQAAEGLGMGYPVHITLEAGADIALGLGCESAAAIGRQLTVGANEKLFKFLALYSGAGHGHTAFYEKSNGKPSAFHYSYTTQIRICLYFFEKIFIG